MTDQRAFDADNHYYEAFDDAAQRKILRDNAEELTILRPR